MSLRHPVAQRCFTGKETDLCFTWVYKYGVASISRLLKIILYLFAKKPYTNRSHPITENTCWVAQRCFTWKRDRLMLYLGLQMTERYKYKLSGSKIWEISFCMGEMCVFKGETFSRERHLFLREKQKHLQCYENVNYIGFVNGFVSGSIKWIGLNSCIVGYGASSV